MVRDPQQEDVQPGLEDGQGGVQGPNVSWEGVENSWTFRQKRLLPEGADGETSA